MHIAAYDLQSTASWEDAPECQTQTLWRHSHLPYRTNSRVRPEHLESIWLMITASADRHGGSSVMVHAGQPLQNPLILSTTQQPLVVSLRK